MAISTDTRLPRLRLLDVRPMQHDGQVWLALRDPLQLSERVVTIPRQLAPVLALCDGTRDTAALRASLGVRFGLRVGARELENFLAALDEAFLLDNERFAQAREQALEDYRRAPFRPSLLAGQSYPDDADELRRALSGYVEAAGDVPPAPDGARGLVSPHIDYPRGGPVYGRVWQRAAEAVRAADLVVVLGTDHFGGEGGLTLTRQHYRTPFGVLPTARGVVDALAGALGEEAAFGGELYHRSEHSVELAAVWLHYVRGGEPCELVPVLCGSFGPFVRGEAPTGPPGRDLAMAAFVDVLGRETAGRRVLVVASADLAHVGPAFGGPPQGLVERAHLSAADEGLIERVCAGDAQGFFETVQQAGDRYNVCGLPPIYLALRLLDPVQGERVAYERCPADGNGTSLVTICGVLWR